MVKQRIGLLALALIILVATGCSRRQLNFPKDRSMGDLFVMEVQPSFTSGVGELSRGSAKGNIRVRVPNRWLLRLEVNPEAARDLSPLTRLNPYDLEWISFGRSGLLAPLTDDNLMHLSSLSGLRVLDLSATEITGTGFVHLRNLSQLESFYLTLSKVGDVGFSDLKDLPNLRLLDVSKTKINDNALTFIKDIHALKELRLYYTGITDEGLEALKAMTQLQRLDLGWTRITDDGLDNLKDMDQLRSLVLDSTKITDTGLRKLKELSSLREVRLYNTSISEAGVLELSKHVSPCSITTDDSIDRKKLFPWCFGP